MNRLKEGLEPDIVTNLCQHTTSDAKSITIKSNLNFLYKPLEIWLWLLVHDSLNFTINSVYFINKQDLKHFSAKLNVLSLSDHISLSGLDL